MDDTTKESPVDNQPEAASTNEEGETQVEETVSTQDPVDNANIDPAHDTPKEEGNESVEGNTPAKMTEKESSAVRKMHEATQEAAKYKKEADAFQDLLNHPEFNEFLEWQKNKKNPSQPPEVPKVELSEDDLLAAQTDPAKFNDLVNSRLQEKLNPLAQQVMQEIGGLKRELAISKQEREIDAFAIKNPDFWDIDPRIMKAAIQDTQGQGISAAYKTAKQLESQYSDKARSATQKKVEEKKQASTHSPSKHLEPKTIYVSTEAEAERVAFQQAKLGKRVDVKVKKQ